ncbi:MAG: SoxR reducing system RseC family protein [Nitrospirota bacterium]|jgi:sigma-E factor negative regulatory protein RseC
MEEVGSVKSIQGPLATVVVAKKSACEHCTAGTCTIKGGGAEIEALNEAGAKVGQRVRVELQAYSYVKGSIMIYGLPAVALIAGAIAGKELVGARWGLDSDLVSAIFAFGAFALSFIVVKLWSKGAEKSTGYRPVVKEILE